MSGRDMDKKPLLNPHKNTIENVFFFVQNYPYEDIVVGSDKPLPTLYGSKPQLLTF